MYSGIHKVLVKVILWYFYHRKLGENLQENIDWMLESGLIDQKVEVSDVMVDLGE